MSRLAGVQRGGTLFTRLIFFFTKRRLGRVVQPQRIMALQPPVLRGFALMELSQQSAAVVPARLKVSRRRSSRPASAVRSEWISTLP